MQIQVGSLNEEVCSLTRLLYYELEPRWGHIINEGCYLYNRFWLHEIKKLYFSWWFRNLLKADDAHVSHKFINPICTVIFASFT